MPCACCNGGSHTKETFEPFIDPIDLAKRCRLDNGPKTFAYPLAGPETSPRNFLQNLPVECYQACLSYLDIASLTTLRRVSQFTRHSIDSLPQYRDVYEHAPQALRACLSTRVASYIPILRLHNSLTTMECFYCHKKDPLTPSFGTYLSLFECRRACLFCLRNSPDLYPVELVKLVELCCQRNCSIRSIDSFRLLGTLPGIYGPSSTPISKNSTLVRGPSVTTMYGVQLSEKEQRTLFGKKESVDIHHHPLVQPSDESDISPSRFYVDPSSPKRTLSLYQTAISFPYLSSSRRIADYGILCGDCNLHMRWEENRWLNEQLARRGNGVDPSATDKIRAHINEVRRSGCVMFSVSEEARRDGEELVERTRQQRISLGRDKDTEGNEIALPGLSIQEHRRVHAREKLPREEGEYRAKMKARPLVPPQPTHAT